MATIRHKGDFDEIGAAYPACTQFVTSDVTLPVQGSPATQVNATIEHYGVNPAGEPRYLLTVWDSSVSKPVPQSLSIQLGGAQVGLETQKTTKKKTPQKKAPKKK